MAVIVFFCFKNPYPFQNHSPQKEHSQTGKKIGSICMVFVSEAHPLQP